MSEEPSRSGRGRRKRQAAAKEKLAVVRRDPPQGGGWEFVHPRCSRRRREDIEEVEAMVEAGENDIARDELVWLLGECPDFLDAHVQLGLIALEEDDPKLARGHFGRAYELAIKALDAVGGPQPVPYALDGNKAFFHAAKGLVHCLVEMGRQRSAKEVCQRIAPLDPTDPLGIQRVVPR